MKQVSICIVLSFVLSSVHAQYYYKDIIVAKDLMNKQKLYQQNKVRSVKYASFEANNQPIEGFSCEQSVSNNFSTITTITNTTLSGSSESSTYFNTKGQLVQSVDTADGNKTVTDYRYDAADRITTIVSTSTSPGAFLLKEEHRLSYNGEGKPEKIVKIKNGKDTTYISFVLDEKGNIAEEKSTNKNQALPTVFYYYDPQNRVTDIVRYNNVAKRLLPDYIFEYENNRLATMLVAEEGTSDYQKWYYSYDEDGLKIQDACYSKSKVLIGRVEYHYEYYP
jgi:YD repeat-containing protein